MPIGGLGGLIGLGEHPNIARRRFDCLWRYWLAGALPTGHGAQRITTAMASGSIIGATVGGLVVAYAPGTFLKLLLGCVPLAAAVKTAAHSAKT